LRPIVPLNRDVTFRTSILSSGQPGSPPPLTLRLHVNGEQGPLLPQPRAARKGKEMPYTFPHRFATPGVHLLSLTVEVEGAAEDRKAGRDSRDRVPADNRQDFAVEVLPALPVLLVDGDESSTAKERGTDFLLAALTPEKDKAPAVKARAIRIDELTPEDLLPGEKDRARGKARPRVLVLSNVGKLSPVQVKAVDQFVAEGGGLLVTLGARVNAEHYNTVLFAEGKGWLPAKLDDKFVGDELEPPQRARPDPTTFTHPTVELFRQTTVEDLASSTFPRWWKLVPPDQHSAASVVGSLRPELDLPKGKRRRAPARKAKGAGDTADSSYPFLVEKMYKAGPVMVCALPLDTSWGQALNWGPAFAPLAHELIYHLARARSSDYNLRAGQPLRYREEAADIDVSQFKLKPPFGDLRPLSTDPLAKDTHHVQLFRQDRESVLVYNGARVAGTYYLVTPYPAGPGEPGGRVTANGLEVSAEDKEGQARVKMVSYVVQGASEEADLTPATETQKEEVVKSVPGLKYENDGETIHKAGDKDGPKFDLWAWLLGGLILLLCVEVWMTRRMVKNRA
jgi:hypothetical protein